MSDAMRWVLIIVGVAALVVLVVAALLTAMVIGSMTLFFLLTDATLCWES